MKSDKVNATSLATNPETDGVVNVDINILNNVACPTVMPDRLLVVGLSATEVISRDLNKTVKP